MFKLVKVMILILEELRRLKKEKNVLKKNLLKPKKQKDS
jgi:hypothetical protein